MSNAASFFARVLLGGLVAATSPLVSAQRDARQAFGLAVPLAPTRPERGKRGARRYTGASTRHASSTDLQA